MYSKYASPEKNIICQSSATTFDIAGKKKSAKTGRPWENHRAGTANMA